MILYQFTHTYFGLAVDRGEQYVRVLFKVPLNEIEKIPKHVSAVLDNTLFIRVRHVYWHQTFVNGFNGAKLGRQQIMIKLLSYYGWVQCHMALRVVANGSVISGPGYICPH